MGKARKRAPRPAGAAQFTSKEFKPYALAIGQIALAWNELHEMLGMLFRHLMGDEIDDRLVYVWQSAAFDRPKRAMLEAAINNISVSEERNNPRAKEDIIWLIRRVDALEDDRNNAIHAPLYVKHGLVLALLGGAPGIAVEDVWGNKRAEKLKGKNLLTEYRWCRDMAVVLRDYGEAIYDAWGFGKGRRHAWPEKPQLPNRGQKSSKKARTQQDLPTPLPLLPEASQE